VTTSLEADGLAGGMITYRLASALFSVRFKTHQRRGPWPVAKACGGMVKKKKGAHRRARLRRTLSSRGTGVF
jgi:hypothetical protein